MSKMKHIIEDFIVPTISIYLLCSLVWMSLNPTEWHWVGRFILMFTGIVSFLNSRTN